MLPLLGTFRRAVHLDIQLILAAYQEAFFMYRLTSEQRQTVASVAAPADRHVAPYAADIDQSAAFPRQAVTALGGRGLLCDAPAPVAMAPTTDQAHDFIGRALCGPELFS